MATYNELVQMNKKYEALKAQQPHLKAKLDAVIAYNNKQIAQIRQTQPKIIADPRVPTASTVNLSGGSTMANDNYAHNISKYLNSQEAMLNSTLKQLEVQMEKEASLLKNTEATMRNGQVPNAGPKTMQHNFMQVAAKLRPGNLGDINRVVWPFFFSTSKATLVPNSTVQGNVTITQEAAFIWLGHTKVVFVEDVGNPGFYTAVDPEQPGASGKSNNITMSIRDSSSSRTFMNKSIDLNQVGDWKYPTILPTPQLLLPNSNLEFQFSNNDQINTYRPIVTLYGLRVRIEDAQNILSTISA